MIHKAFIRRHLIRSKQQSMLFMMCVVLSILSMVAVGGFSESIRYALEQDAKSIHAADIIIRSRSPVSESLNRALEALEGKGLVESAKIHEFYSMVGDPVRGGTLLSSIKVVTPSYPFYGRVELVSQTDIKTALRKGSVIVEQNLLDRLHLKIGSRVKIGQATLRITDVVLKEPDRPVSFFSLGPRVFVSSQDLAALDLVDKASRIRYVTLLKVTDSDDLNRLIADLRAAAADHERIETYRSARSRMKRFFDNFLFYLGLIGLFTLLLAGIGIQSSLSALLRENRETIGVMKTVGAGSRFIIVHFSLMVLFLGLVGTLIGICFGFLTQQVLIFLLQSFLPRGFEFVFSWKAFLEGLILGSIVVMLFTFIPLLRIKEIKPSVIFRREETPSPKPVWRSLVGVGLLAVFFGIVLWQLQDASISLRFVAAGIGFILMAAGLAHIILGVIKHVHVSALAPRQSLRGLFRPGNATKLIVVTFTGSLTVICSIYLIELNLSASFLHSFPPSAPNLYFLDIQPDQKEAVSEILGPNARYYPIVRARMISINGRPVERRKQEIRRRDSLTRMFNLTYRNELLPDERIKTGKHLFRTDKPGIQVSVLDTVQEMADIKLGDTLMFRVQGIPLDAKVSSIRTRINASIQPYFYFVFPENVLGKAPQTIFAAIRIDGSGIASLQNSMVARFPNISVIDMTQVITGLAGMLKKLSLIVRLYAGLSIAAGIFILIGSIFATRSARVKEAVYFKILGARKRFVLRVFAYENLLIGLISSFLAVGFSQTASYLISTYFFHIPYRPFWGICLLLMAGAAAVICATGSAASVSILLKKPILFLRTQAEG